MASPTYDAGGQRRRPPRPLRQRHGSTHLTPGPFLLFQYCIHILSREPTAPDEAVQQLLNYATKTLGLNTKNVRALARGDGCSAEATKVRRASPLPSVAPLFSLFFPAQLTYKKTLQQGCR